jgi:hypothetical protein
MTATGYPAPLKDELMEKVVPLPAPEIKEPEAKKPSGGQGGGSTGEKKIPKYVLCSLASIS